MPATQTNPTRPLVEVVYSPACPPNAYFLAAVKQWLADYLAAGSVQLKEVRTDLAPERAAELSGVSDLGQLKSNIFIAVYVAGHRVSSVPLHPDEVINGVRAALDQPVLPTPTAPRAWWGAPTSPTWTGNPAELSFAPLTEKTISRSLHLCLNCHPAGTPTPAEHQPPGRQLKQQLLKQAFTLTPIIGIVARAGDQPAGIIECYPRRLARAAGFVTGDDPADDRVLTVTCIEVAGGFPRIDVIDALMSNLLKALSTDPPTQFDWLEGNGIYGWLDGTNPYWVFEKHGFQRVREIVPGKRVLMLRRLGGGEHNSRA